MKKMTNTICYLSLGFIGFYLAVYQNAMESIRDSFRITATVSGFIIAIHFVGMFFMPIVMGEISDRFGKKSMLVLSFFIFATGLLLLLSAKVILVFAMGIFLIGCGYSVIESLSSGILADENPLRIQKVILLSQMFFCLGAMTGPLIAMLLPSDTEYFRWMFRIVLALNGIFILLVSLSDIHPLTAEIGKIRGSIALRLLRQPTFLLLALCILLYVGIENAVGFWAQSTYSKMDNASVVNASFGISLFWGGMALGRYLAFKLSLRAIHMVIIGMTLSCFASVMILLSFSVWVNSTSFFFVGVGFACVWPLLASNVVDLNPDFTATSMGLVMASSAAGGFVIPMLMGMTEDRISSSAAFMYIPVISIMVLLIYWKQQQFLKVYGRKTTYET